MRELFTALEDAWNRGDGQAYGACFTEDASYSTFIGTVYRGRDEIGRCHQALFDGPLKGTRMYNELVETRHYGPDHAVVLGRGEVGRKRPRKLPKVQTYMVVREADGQWRFAAFHNTKRKALMEALMTRLQPKSAPRK